MFTLQIAFLGRRRPLNFEAATLDAVANLAAFSLREVERLTAREIVDFIHQCTTTLKERPSYSMVSREGSGLAVTLRRGPHDTFLDALTRDLPPLPGADYSRVKNA